MKQKRTQFKPGISGNPAGRPRGALSKVARPLKLSIADFLEQRFTELPEIWDQLKPKERAQLFTDLLPYVIPKMTTGDFNLTLGQLSDQDIDLLIEKLFNNEQRQNQ